MESPDHVDTLKTSYYRLVLCAIICSSLISNYCTALLQEVTKMQLAKLVVDKSALVLAVGEEELPEVIHC